MILIFGWFIEMHTQHFNIDNVIFHKETNIASYSTANEVCSALIQNIHTTTATKELRVTINTTQQS